MIRERGCGYRRTHDETAIGIFRDARHFADFLDIYNQTGRRDAGAHLHQQIRPTRQNPRSPLGRGKGADRFIKRLWRQISSICHERSYCPCLACDTPA